MHSTVKRPINLLAMMPPPNRPSRFRLMPKQPTRHSYICDFIVSHSIKAILCCFTGLTDPNLFAEFTYKKSGSSTPVRQFASCTIIDAVHSNIHTQAVRGEILRHHPDTGFVGIADAHRAIILDTPIFYWVV